MKRKFATTCVHVGSEPDSKTGIKKETYHQGILTYWFLFKIL